MTYTLDMPSEEINGIQAEPLFRGNFGALNTYLGVNHIPLNKRNGGKHNFVQMPGTSQPTVTDKTQGLLYVSTTNTRLTYVPGDTGNRYRLTSTDMANFATFGNVTEYLPTRFGGWTFLPGEILLQYGYIDAPNIGAGGTVLFPKEFVSKMLSIQFGFMIQASLRTINFSIASDGTNDKTQFTYNYSETTDQPFDVDRFYWIATGL